MTRHRSNGNGLVSTSRLVFRNPRAVLPRLMNQIDAVIYLPVHRHGRGFVVCFDVKHGAKSAIWYWRSRGYLRSLRGGHLRWGWCGASRREFMAEGCGSHVSGSRRVAPFVCAWLRRTEFSKSCAHLERDWMIDPSPGFGVAFFRSAEKRLRYVK
jgi:hypothetical protein